MINNFVQQPCEVALHVGTPDVFIHPPPPHSRVPGNDQTVSGLVELRCPSERTIQGVKVTLQGLQTLAFPEPTVPNGIRWEEKIVMNKTVEILNSLSASAPTPPSVTASAPATTIAGDGGDLTITTSAEAEPLDEEIPDFQDDAPKQPRITAPDMSRIQSVNVKHEGLHLTKGVHQFEYAFIIPATSPPFERTKHGRLRYILTATAIGAGRGKGNVSTWQEIYVISQVAADGGPTALDVQFHDIHEALGPMSVSLTSASLTVGGTAALHVYHPDPPPGLGVHVIRVFLEQTIELYSSVRKAWLKLPMEKLRLWEKGCMPYKARHPEHVSEKDTIWFARTDPATGQATRGTPGRGAGDGRPSLAPFGESLVGTFAQHAVPGPARAPREQREGYELKAILRLPEHRICRPSTVRGSKTDIRITHEIGVEVFFSRLSVVDQRQVSDSFGQPKVQVFSMRRAVAIPSCAFTYDTIHLPPYSLESPLPSRPGSPSNRLSFSTLSAPGTPGATPGGLGGRSPMAQVELDAWKASTPLVHTLPSLTHPFSSRSSPSGSCVPSRPGSCAGSREPSPEREERRSRSHARTSLGSGLAAALGRRSRHSSPERSESAPDLSRPSLSRRGSSVSLHRPRGLHAFTPSHPVSRGPSPPPPASTVPTSASVNPSSPVQWPSNSSSTVPSTPSGVPITTFGGYFPPISGTSTPTRPGSPAPQRPGLGSRSSSFTQRSLANLNLSGPPGAPASGSASIGGPTGGLGNSTAPTVPPWSTIAGYGTGETKTSHLLCNCGRTTDELAEAEQRLLDGIPTAPGAWVDLHDPGSDPPPWMPPSTSSATSHWDPPSTDAAQTQSKLSEIVFPEAGSPPRQ